MKYLKPDDIKPNDILDKGIINNYKQNIMEYLHLRKKKAFEVPYVGIMSIAKSEDKFYKPKKRWNWYRIFIILTIILLTAGIVYLLYIVNNY